MKTCSIVLFVLLIGTAAAAQPRPADKQFGNLFRTPTTTGPSVRLQQPQARLPKPTQPFLTPPTVVCGMTLVPGDPKIDKGIQHEAPKTPRFSIQTIQPQVCRR